MLNAFVSQCANTGLLLMDEFEFIDNDELLTELLSRIGEGTGSVEQLHAAPPNPGSQLQVPHSQAPLPPHSSLSS